MPRVAHVRDGIPGAIYVGRPMPRQRLKGHILANPFKIGRDGSRQEVIDRYKEFVVRDSHRMEALADLRSAEVLCCWCRHDGEPRTAANGCHGDVLIDLLNTYTDDELRELAVQK